MKEQGEKRESINGEYFLVKRDGQGKILTKRPWTYKKPVKTLQPIIYSTEQSVEMEDIFHKYINEIRKYPRISEMRGRFRNTKGKMTVLKGNISRDKREILNAYRNLLGGTMDEKELDENINIIATEKARNILLKKRISVQITLESNEGVLAVIDAYGVLLEKSNNITEFWVGRVVESNNIDAHRIEFENSINAKSTRASVSGKRGMVTKVSTEWKFA